MLGVSRSCMICGSVEDQKRKFDTPMGRKSCLRTRHSPFVEGKSPRARLARGQLFSRRGSRLRHINPCHLNPLPCQDWRRVSWVQTRERQWTGSHIPCWSFRLCRKVHTDLFGFGHFAKVELDVSGLLNVGQDVNVGFDADGAQMAFVTSISLLGYISNCIQPSPFGLAQCSVSQACPQRPTSVQSRSRNPVSPVFSPPLCGSSRALHSKKLQ